MKNYWTLNEMSDMSGRTVVITGCTSGIGLEAARVFASKGARVLMACRHEPRARDAMAQIHSQYPGAALEFVALDLSVLGSVRVAVAAIRGRLDRLDLLINNAGVMWLPHGLSVDGFEQHMATNHFGHFALTAGLLPLMSNVVNSRVVTVASLAHRSGRIEFDDMLLHNGYTPHAAYGRSKLANLLFALELDRRLRSVGALTASVACHPGISSTALTEDWSANHPWRQRLIRLMPLVAQEASKGALPTLCAATAHGVQGGDYIGPRWFECFGAPVKVGMRRLARREDIAATLWEVSESLTGARFPF